MEVEAAAQAAAADATKAREQALDPAVVVDTAEAGAALATAELTRDRLRAALPRLQQRHEREREREDLAAWKVHAEELEARRVDLGTEFKGCYPAMIERIVNHLHQMRVLDQEIGTLNSRRPSGDVQPLNCITPAFAMDLRIPDHDKKGEPLWPPPQLNPAVQLARAMLANPNAFTDPFIASEAAAGTYLKEGNRRMLEDNRRQIAEAEERTRAHEEREAAEARQAQEADRAAYYGEHGWPT
jgi:hypothetical protein